MKKLLSLTLVLLMCLSAFVACDNTDASSTSSSSSSESESVSESQSESESESKKQSEPVASVQAQTQYEYYRKLTQVGYTGDDFPAIADGSYDNYDYGNYYKIISSYSELCELVDAPEKIGEEIFDEYFVLAICRYLANGGEAYVVGYRDFRIEDGVAYIVQDMATYPTMVITNAISVRTNYYAIPKELLTVSVSEITECRETESSQHYLESRRISVANAEYEDYTYFIITTKDELNSFRSAHGIEQSISMYDTDIIIAIYFGSQENTVGYYSPSADENGINLFKTVVSNPSAEDSDSGACFRLITVPKSKIGENFSSLSSLNITVNQSVIQ